MLFRSVVALAFATLALSTPVKRFQGITVDLSAPSESVKSIDELTFTATVTNTGSETVKLLKYGTILDGDLPTKSFIVTKNGEDVEFTGIKLSVSLTDADDSAFAIIPAGESVTVTHNVAALYNFESAGAGKFAFEPLTNFIVAGAEGIVSADTVAKISPISNTVVVEIFGDVSKRELGINKRAVDICTNASHKSFIDASYSEAKTLANDAASYISSRGSGDTLYRAYYGTTSTTTVGNIFRAVASENSSSRTLSCTDSFNGCSSGVIAYTVISTTNIYFCSIFFNEATTASLCSGTSVAARNARGGTVLHELTHAVGGTDDITYGCSADQALAASSKPKNADNYNCFSTQVYQSTAC